MPFIPNKRSVSRSGCFLAQTVFIVGTYNPNNSPNLSTVTSVSYVYGPPESMVMSLYGESRTKENLLRDGVFTANLCTVAMGGLADYVGALSGTRFTKDALPAEWVPGVTVNAPVLTASPYIMECRVTHTHPVGDTLIITSEIANYLLDTNLGCPEDNTDKAYMEWLDARDLQAVDPLLYAWRYYRTGEKLGRLGELQPEAVRM